ncbi:VOC family protein [Vallitalea guaymasensis]|uniref:VOC family protein n=1 Tax=Vallitalea guaymasensis TaxID=1185412 RepID=A0A8J8MDG3_9FIRM|nr:VOC family protein [Vallitalea guaymasensis]QUH31019.1 VOC family protein [Vallitalea guaymasensis]
MGNAKKGNTMFILYVKNQEYSKDFYTDILEYEPILHVPGMTEFKLSEGVSLGIMPEEGIRRIMGNEVPNPSEGNGIPRCEIYLFVDNPDKAYTKLIEAGGKGVSSCELRPWGDYVSYGADPDGHIIAFAKKHE